MNGTSKVLVAAALLASASLNIYQAVRWSLPLRTSEVQLQAPDQVEVIRTHGGLLQVSTIRSPETFQASADHRLLGIDLGETVTQIRVPAFFNYHIELQKDWPVTVAGDRVLVIAPAVSPTLPVAIDTAHLQKFSSGTWSIFTGSRELDTLERSISQALALKASSPTYIQYQRESARKTVEEFVRKWLLDRPRYHAMQRLSIQVFFSDEQIGEMSKVSPVFLAASGPAASVATR